ncbi:MULTISPECIES: sensor histidine kinase [Sphingomonas]|uniref:sensor histidine kinase n=1 Tax=Sphingomonas TaxID=13687 RepID=UPI000DEEF11E|nr:MULTISPECIES: sensor histidine kinase [Sphingomonas]
MPERGARRLVTRHEFSGLAEVAIGLLVAALAVFIRYHLPLPPQQLPTVTTVIALAIVTGAVGTLAGLTTAIVGGALSWYFFFNSERWDSSVNGWVQLLGFSVIALVIVTTTSFFRSSERQRYRRELEVLARETEQAELFAREMAHRLKNALTIVQSLAFQTFGHDTALARTFAGRLKTIVEANQLLSEHISRPTADVREVVKSALKLFDSQRMDIRHDCTTCLITDSQVISLAMAIHELGTNAVKYGAWSTPAGLVTIRTADAGEWLRFSWEESGGPPAVPPTATGFGTRLLHRAGREVALDYAPDGLRYSVLLARSA